MIPLNRTFIIEIISSLFILLFIYTGLTKLLERESFRVVLRESPFIGDKSVYLSWLLPIVELLTAVLLFIPSIRKWGLLVTTFLMAIFSSYVGYMVSFMSDLPCSCGGVLADMTWIQHLIFNIFFTTLAIIGLWLSIKNKLFIAINRQS